ncbi:hypothetical protein KC874_05310 [Candidatus Saccharibacteria bacterium]|nr:hypothetical protein [Candidatus Saccharibacteria bacterium]
MINHKGFSAVIVLLSILVLTAIGFTGYYVWNTQQEDDQLNAANQQSATLVSQEPTNTNNSPVDTQKYLVINEWGVKIPTPDADKATYTYYKSPSGTEYQGLIDIEFDSYVTLLAKNDVLTDKNCSNLGVVMYRSTEKPKDEAWTYKKVGNYYFTVTGSPSICSENAQDEDLRKSLISVFMPENVILAQ